MKLADKLHISDVESLHKSLSSLLDSEQSVIIDISDVTQADTASIQVLCALQKSLSVTANSIEWVGHSKSLHTAAGLLGVNTYLNLPTP